MPLQKSFTLLELLLVILITSIITITLIPKFKIDKLDIATSTLLTHLRYTRSLALKNDNFKLHDKNYFKKLWQIVFSKSKYSEGFLAYTIFRDDIGKSSGNPDINEIAINPLNPSQLLSGGFTGTIKTSDKRATKSMNLGKEYGVKVVKLDGGCKYYNSRRISFDYMGRALKGNPSSYKRPYQRIIKSKCRIILCSDEECLNNRIIIIEPTSGFIHL